MPSETLKTESFSIPEFAELGMAGLRSEQTVRRYRNQWQRAIDAGKALVVRPGDGYEVPELDWDTPPGEPKTRGPKTGITGMLPPLPSVIRETVAEQPEAAAAALNALMSKRELRVLTAARLQQAQDEQEPPLLNREASEQEDDTLFALEAELVRLIGVYRNLFSAVRPGEASTEARVQAQGSGSASGYVTTGPSGRWRWCWNSRASRRTSVPTDGGTS
jgi:hypothetical protein